MLSASLSLMTRGCYTFWLNTSPVTHLYAQLWKPLLQKKWNICAAHSATGKEPVFQQHTGISANASVTSAKANKVPEIILAMLAQVIDAAGMRARPPKSETLSRCQQANHDQGFEFIPRVFGMFASGNDAKANITKGKKSKLLKKLEIGKLKALHHLLWVRRACWGFRQASRGLKPSSWNKNIGSPKHWVSISGVALTGPDLSTQQLN